MDLAAARTLESKDCSHERCSGPTDKGLCAVRSMACKPRLNNAARTTYGDCNEGGSESSDWGLQLVALRSAFRRRRGTDVKCIGLGRSDQFSQSSRFRVDFSGDSTGLPRQRGCRTGFSRMQSSVGLGTIDDGNRRCGDIAQHATLTSGTGSLRNHARHHFGGWFAALRQQVPDSLQVFAPHAVA